MNQQLKTLLAVAFCAVVFSNCSKHTGKQLAAGNNLPVKRGLSLNKDQKIQINNTVKTVNTMEMMGQSMDVTADIIMTRLLEVKDKKENSYNITSTITKMNFNSSMMGQNMSYDSDKKEDGESELGKVLKEQVNVPKDMELDNDGRMINVQKDTTKKATDEGNPMMAMIEKMGAAQDESNGANDAFMVLAPGVKTSDTWSDSSTADGFKVYRNYLVKEIKGNEATIVLTGTQAITNNIDNGGMQVNITLDSKLSGEILVDITTGIVKQRTLTMEGAGNADVMGQSIPMVTKVTTTSAIKSL